MNDVLIFIAAALASFMVVRNYQDYRIWKRPSSIAWCIVDLIGATLLALIIATRS